MTCPFCAEPALLPSAFDGQRDLAFQEVGEFDPLRLQRLGVERGLGQARQGVGFEIDQPLLRNDEIGAGIFSQ